MAETGAIVATSSEASSYRVKFDREHFIEMVGIARPRLVYRRKNMHFFAYDGFVMYCDQCQASDFTEKVIGAIEFPNVQWEK